MFAFPTAIFNGAVTELSVNYTSSMYDVYLPHEEPWMDVMSGFSFPCLLEKKLYFCIVSYPLKLSLGK